MTIFAAEPFTLVAGTNPGLTVPPAATNAGFTKLAFFEDFTNTATAIAPAATTASGYSFYWSFPGSENPPAQFVGDWTVHPTSSAASVTAGQPGGGQGTNFSANGGILTSSLSASSSNLSGMITVPGGHLATLGTAATVPTFGNWKHCYMEAYIQVPNVIQPTNPNGWPSFWSWSLAALGNGGVVNPETSGFGFGGVTSAVLSSPTFGSWAEVDFFETFGGQGGNRADGYYTGTMYNHPTSGATTNNFAAVGSPNTIVVLDELFHTYGCLWTSTGTNTGQVSFYFDNQLLTMYQTPGSQGQLTPPGTQFFPTGTGSSLGLTALEQGPIFMILGAGINFPANFDWVRVWNSTGNSPA